ncbi:MAG: OmpA family protein [Polyangiaceae bacterium]|nr:OmpA family protein [Polyangiaceae bacterium]
MVQPLVVGGREGSRGRSSSSWLRLFGAAVTCLATLVAVAPARAQQRTFYLDRAQLSGAPDDAYMVWRPYMHESTRFYGSFALGYTLNPLRDTTATDNGNVQNDIDNLVQHQLITYLSVGTEIASRVGFNVLLPIAVFQAGGDDPQEQGVGSGLALSTAAVHDLRFDVRLKAYESDSGMFRAGGAAALWFPTGNEDSYASDAATTGALFGNLEFDFGSFLLAGHVGPHLRPKRGIAGDNGRFGLHNELRWAGGAYLDLREGRVRLGGEIWGNTGLDENQHGDGTFFTARNTDLEWTASARFTLDERQRWYATGGAGTRLAAGYGAPDVRVLASIGTYWTLRDVNPKSPDRKFRVAPDVAEKEKDSDGDGYPDSIDACPMEKEDGEEPDATDGCPKPSDRDGDGLPDSMDKCPDQPEDFDNVQDGDGCPEDDADNDKVPDVEDACPGEPGPRSKIAEKNGCPSLTRVTEEGEVQLLEAIQFDTAKATIKPVSFPILDEVVTLMEARPEIRIGVYGHTDNRGGAPMNLKLSKDRAASVVKYLVGKGIDPRRLESEGYGQEKPIDTNDTDAGRAKNRRVEFKILDE